MRTLRPEHPLAPGTTLHRALCALLCVLLVWAGGFGAVTPVATGGACAPAQACCCGDADGLGDSGDAGGCADVCACEVPSTPPAPTAPVVASPSLVDLATPPDREPVALVSVYPPALRGWRITVASHPLAARALHVAHCVFLC